MRKKLESLKSAPINQTIDNLQTVVRIRNHSSGIMKTTVAIVLGLASIFLFHGRAGVAGSFANHSPAMVAASSRHPVGEIFVFDGARPVEKAPMISAQPPVRLDCGDTAHTVRHHRVADVQNVEKRTPAVDCCFLVIKNEKMVCHEENQTTYDPT